MEKFQTIKGVGPYTAAVITSHAIRDHSAIGLDVWNRKILARKLLGLDDAEVETVRAEVSRLFPGWEGLAGLYLVEEDYVENPASPLVDEVRQRPRTAIRLWPPMDQRQVPGSQPPAAAGW